jgi:hypothetical protein
MQGYFDLKINLKVNYKEGVKCWRMFYQMMMICFSFIVTMFMADTHFAYGQVEIKTIEAVGTSVVYKTDVDTAKQQAIANGLVSAVDKAMFDILTVELATQNFGIINKIIYNNTDKYISDYKVLTEAVSKKNYRVLIQAKVSVIKLKSHLAKYGVMRVRKAKFQNVEIVVQGTRNLSNFISFRKGLKEISGVKSVQVSDMQSDETKLLVNFKGSAKEFTEALVLKKFDKFSIRIFEISKNKLRIELISG